MTNQAQPEVRIPPGYLDAYRAELQRRGIDRYKTFQIKYRNSPAKFVQACIKFPHGKAPTAYQLEILDDVILHRKESVRGPHGLGKTAMAAWLVHWFALTRDGEDWKCPTTASAWRQLLKFLWPEIHKWSRCIRWDVVGRAPYDQRLELQTLSLKLGTGEAFAVASDTPELIEGAHGTSILYIFDEAKAIPPETFDAAEGAFSAAGTDTEGEAFGFAISTPGGMIGRFHDIQSRKPGYEDWHTRAVTLDETIAAGRVSLEWAEQRKRQWGEGSSVYKNRVLGEFASTSDDSLIPLEWVEAAVERWYEWKEIQLMLHVEHPSIKEPIHIVGADIADQGEDKTVMAPRIGNVIPELEIHSGWDTMRTTGRLKQFHDQNSNIQLSVDVIGIGAGVVSRLREQGVDVVAFNAAQSSPETDISGELKFLNQRSAAWWNMREMLDPDNGLDVALPDDPELIGELAAIRWAVNSSGKIQVEGGEPTTLFPEGLRKRLGRSPDRASAVVMAFSIRGGAPPRPEQSYNAETAYRIRAREKLMRGNERRSFEVVR